MVSWTKTTATLVFLACLTDRAVSAQSSSMATSFSTVSGSGSAVAMSKAESKGGSAVSNTVAKSNEGTAIASDSVTATNGADVVSTTKAVADGPDAISIAGTTITADGDIQIVSNNFALAIQQGRGPVIAQSIVDAKGKSQNLRNAVERGFINGVAIAIGNTPGNVATIAKTTVDAFFGGSDIKAVFGRAISVLIIEKGCGYVQPFLQLVEAEVSTRGKQGEFLSAINEDVNIITCAFPDTCKNNGVDKRGGCCKSGNAQSSGVCGNCSSGKCDFTRIWKNPRDVWVCNQGVPCENMKPCVCA